MSKLFSLILATLIITFISAVACQPVHGDNPPPAKMDLLASAQLDAAMLHLQSLAQQEAPFIEIINTICAQYKISPSEIGRTVTINPKTGEITRKVEAPAASVAKESAPAKAVSK